MIDNIMEESYDRYRNVKEIVKELETSSPVRRSAQWYDNHSELMKYYRSQLGFYSDLHEDITDPEFRAKMDFLDVLHDKLLKEYNTYQWFSTYDYLRYNEGILWVVDWIVAENEICELLVAINL